MTKLLNVARQRQEELQQLLKSLEKSSGFEECPAGRIKINHSGRKIQYYLKECGRGRKLKYLRKDQQKIAFQIVQRDYEEKLKKVAFKELISIQDMIKGMPETQVEDVYQLFSAERRKLISPYIIPDDEYIKKWENVEYEKKGFMEDSPEYYTAKKERVRSKSEILIADTLGREGIPYRYEFPLFLRGRKIYPDFYKPNKFILQIIPFQTST